ncbi:NUDIX hydrolase [Micrococcus sp.]|uniref:NUDIX hydrolase n=1 Tax=Micrococcus sp. TaxID=1271 RepID=UPI002A910ACE|nr:NUDIX hydrolase [Micrococcus sp.]MDY6055617.1 NUDIX hydrolase [Micrococcus sp.]
MPTTASDRTAAWSTQDHRVSAPDADVLAAGVIPWRRAGKGIEVLVIHRPRYDDWSWPKGKLDPGETLPECAVREVHEEVGLAVRLGIPLAVTAYTVSGRKRKGPLSKEVWYWAADATGLEARPDGDEVDQARWVTPAHAAELLTNETDLEPLEALTAAADRGRLRTTALVVLRHAKAKPRSSWSRAEQERPLAATGRRQALSVASLVQVWAPERLVSSPWRRCVETLAPTVKATRLPLKTKSAFTETTAREKPKKTRRVFRDLLGRRRHQVVCTHRPVLPVLLDQIHDAAAHPARPILRALPDTDPYLRPGAVIVLHQASDGAIVAVEVYDPWDD